LDLYWWYKCVDKDHQQWFDNERRRAIEEEIAKLLDACFIREVLHPD
jgi:hypothetical protein